MSTLLVFNALRDGQTQYETTGAYFQKRLGG